MVWQANISYCLSLRTRTWNRMLTEKYLTVIAVMVGGLRFDTVSSMEH
jgi:hypothetical protein